MNKKIKDPSNYIKKKIKKIFKFNSLKKKRFSLTILLTGNSKMKYLNKKFRNKNKTTDVLSFPNLGTVDLKKKTNTKIYLGDIVINLNKVSNKKNDKNFKNKFNKLWIHGFLHLLGFRHKSDKEYSKMHKLENVFLNFIS